MAVKQFAMPDLGEGLTESELVSWSVAVGDTVELNQVIAEVETAKALVQLPSPFAGTVSRLFVEPGTTVLVGSPIVAIEVGGDGDEPGSAPDSAAVDAAAVPELVEGQPTTERNSVLVGYGPPVEGTGRPVRRARGGAPSTSSGTVPTSAAGERSAPESVTPLRPFDKLRASQAQGVASSGSGAACGERDSDDGCLA